MNRVRKYIPKDEMVHLYWYKISFGPVEDVFIDGMLEADRWCEDNLIGNWTFVLTDYYFKEEQDAALFALTWL